MILLAHGIDYIGCECEAGGGIVQFESSNYTCTHEKKYAVNKINKTADDLDFSTCCSDNFQLDFDRVLGS
jgi:hypothetical protein